MNELPAAGERNPINPLSVYADHGRRAGQAMRRIDIALCRMCRQWLTKALAGEHYEYRAVARATFQDAYREEATRWSAPVRC